MKIVLCAGHDSLKDPGAITKLNGLQYTEQSLMTQLRNKIKFYLEKVGHTVITDGSNNNNLVLREAIGLINKGNIAIDLHLNSHSNKEANGTETLSKKEHSELSKKISKAISGVIGSKLRGNDGWVDYEKCGRQLGFIKNGGIIVESFFLSNDNELQAYLNKEWMVARAIAAAIHNHYEARQFDEIFNKV